jgi:hypothetical protein
MKKDSGRFWLPDWVVDGSLASMGSEVKTLLALVRFANRDGLAWPSVKTISECAGVDERTVRRHLRLLQGRNGHPALISKASAGRGGRGVSTKYRLLFRSWMAFKGTPSRIQTRTPVSGFSCGESVDNSDQAPKNPDRSGQKPGQTESERGTELSGEGSEKEVLKVYGLEELREIGNGNDNGASKGGMTARDADHRRRQMLTDLAEHQATEKALATA